MAITRLAISNPNANTDVLMHTATRAAVASIIATNKGAVSSNISVWIVPSGQDANSSAWMHIASTVTMDAGNSMETFRFPLAVLDKIYIRSTTADVSFSLNALYETNGRANITVQSAAPASPQIGDVWVDSDDNKIYFWNDASWVDAVSELPSQMGNSGKYLTTNGTSPSWGTIDLSGYATTSHASSHGSAGSDAITIDQSQVTNLTTDLGNKEPLITSGTTSQYWRGDKSWQTLDKESVGLSNVENVAVSTWSGSSSLVTVGTISSGIWEGTDIGLANGGTNATLTAVEGGIVYSTSSALAITSVGLPGQVLTSNGTSAPSWQSPENGESFHPFMLAGM